MRSTAPLEHNQILSRMDEATQGLDGTLVSRSHFIDILLDLRADADDDPTLRRAIEEVLGSVPGVTVVEATWARDTLTTLRQQASAPSRA